MINGILGKKIGMTQIFKKTGEVVPVTVVEAGPCVILQVKSTENDSYTALQLGFDIMKESRANKPQSGRFKKIKTEPVRFIREFRVKDTEGIKPSDKVTVDIFEAGEYVDITGTSTGKGFQGGVKRWNWKGGPAGHGSMSHRAPGSIGVTDPARVLKGRHLPGQMGNEKVTTQGLEVAEIDKENNLLLVKGAVPGKNGNYLIIKKSFKKKKKEVKPEEETAGPKKINPLKQSKKKAKARA
ncbi:MAG: 50S ribosomal protein L3 [Candidatus Omnitrophica bacterium]|nr:50S ribosomal protein L3 [Candidatus Omnitrophota bacterium]